jgi:hypothetical protein
MTHQEATCSKIMATINIVMDVPPSSMRHGQKTCVQQQYSSTSNVRKNNVLRAGKNYHHVRVNREQGPTRTDRNWKRPKEVFFTVRGDKSDPEEKVTMAQVSLTYCGSFRYCVLVSYPLTPHMQLDYSQDPNWNRWIQVGLQNLVSRETGSAIQRQVVASIKTKQPVSTNPYEALPLLALPLSSTGFSFDTTVAEAAPSVLPASSRKVLREITLTSALELHNVQTCNSLVTPTQQDAINKSRKIAVALAKKRKTAVAAAPADNGSGALADELQQNQVGPGEPIATSHPPTTATVNTTTVAVATDPSLPKPTKRRKVTQHPTPSAQPIVNGPPELKCQGCVHCDILELKVMEPSIIRHYLKSHEFLELAKCAGDCAQSIQAIHTASPRANIHYCDIGKKGYDAPDDDPKKASMECGLVLCLACYAVRGEKYAVENSKDGATSNRSTRRRRNR